MRHFRNYIDGEVAVLRQLGIPADTRGSLRYVNVTIDGQPQCWHMLHVSSNLIHLGYTEEQLRAAHEEAEWAAYQADQEAAHEESVCASYAARGQANLY